MAKTIVGLYENFETAREVRSALVSFGFAENDVNILAANTDGKYSDFVDDNVRTEGDTGTDNSVSEAAGQGALAGGLIGGVGGAVLATGLFAIPGIGPLVVAGSALSGIIGAVVGAISGGLIAGLVEYGISEDDAEVYSEGVRRGYALVTVKAQDEQAENVVSIMNEFDVIDTDERAAYWKNEGWSGKFDSDAPALTGAEIETDRNRYNTYLSDLDSNEQSATATVPIIEEELRVGKRKVEAGAMRIRTYVEEEQVSETVELRKESLHVDRKSVDRAVDSADIDAFQEGVVEVTAMAEEAVVDKQARVVEEVTISKDVDVDSKTVSDTVRRTGVDVDGDDSDTVYRAHYDTTYANSGKDYTFYQPAYQYGHGLTAAPAMASYGTWDTLEPHARRDWEQHNSDADSTWEDVKDAVHSGWMSVKRTVS